MAEISNYKQIVDLCSTSGVSVHNVKSLSVEGGGMHMGHCGRMAVGFITTYSISAISTNDVRSNLAQELCDKVCQ